MKFRLKNLSKTISLLALLSSAIGSYAMDFSIDPKSVPIVYDDMENIRKILQNYAPDEINSDLIQKEYFDKGSKGLKALIQKDRLNSEDFSAYVRDNYSFLLDVSLQTDIIRRDSSKMRDLLLAFDELIEKPQFKPTYFVIGQGKHGGTRTEEGFIIEIQKNVLGLEGIEFDGVDSFGMQPYANIDRLWVHEQVHVSRPVKYVSGSLIRVSLDEGSCNFIAYVITGKKGNDNTYNYGYANQQELINSWKIDLKEDVRKVRPKWVWNWSRQKKEYPPDLGYFIGFLISQKYYEGQEDKKQAIQDIHDMFSYEDLYEKSGF